MESVTVISVEAGDWTDAGEAWLTERARSDRLAFAELYQRYLTPIYRYLRTRTQCDEDAADLTQQVFVRALEAIGSFHHRGLPVSAWLFRIARNAAIDAHRRRRASVAWDLLPEALHPCSHATPESVSLRREELSQLAELLARLNPDRRELLALRFAGGLSVAEIAATVGKREETVKKQLYRALQSLKEQYREIEP